MDGYVVDRQVRTEEQTGEQKGKCGPKGWMDG